MVNDYNLVMVNTEYSWWKDGDEWWFLVISGYEWNSPWGISCQAIWDISEVHGASAMAGHIWWLEGRHIQTDVLQGGPENWFGNAVS